MYISIVMATFNGEKFLREQIDSILNQTYRNFELIIGDDCSNDGTLSILKDYAQKDDRIRIVENKVNLGFKKNFENLLSLAKGDYIAFSDQDDIWTLNHLELLLSKADEYDLVCSNSSLIDSEGNSLNTTMKDVMRIKHFHTDADSIKIHLMHFNFVQGSACLVSKNLLTKALPIPENMKFHDYWLGFCAAFCKGIYYFDECLLYYRQHGENVTENKKWNIFRKIFITRARNLKQIQDQLDLLNCFADNYRGDVPSELSIIRNAISYFENLRAGRNFKSIKYFNKNYDAMFFDDDKKLRIMRFIKLFILRT